MATLPHETATDDEIAAFCLDPNNTDAYLAGPPYGNQVYKLSEIAVVKFGLGVKEEEANNQRQAYRLLDPHIVRVPNVYRFFFKEELGYIVMEYMHGRVLEPNEDASLIVKIADILTYLRNIRSSSLGPLGGGASRGILWSEGEEPLFHVVEDLEAWFNRRLRHGQKVDFHNCEFVLCHLDIAPRNLLLLEDNSICLLDWASTGFYPRTFEESVLRITYGLEGSFISDLKSRDLTDEEEGQIGLILQAYYNTVRYYFRPLPNNTNATSSN